MPEEGWVPSAPSVLGWSSLTANGGTSLLEPSQKSHFGFCLLIVDKQGLISRDKEHGVLHAAHTAIVV